MNGMNANQRPTDKTSAKDASDWAPISDLMAALMMIFMFLMIVFLRNLSQVEDAYRQECARIHEDLVNEFSADFENWNVSILEDLTIRFTNPDLLFDQQSTTIRPGFQQILQDFLPRYLRLLHEVDSNPEERITEIRIEGHSSSEWAAGTPRHEAYILNMDLSQGRARAILALTISLPGFAELEDWAIPLLTANGLSSARPVLTAAGAEDAERSRRIEFRIVTRSCQRGGVYET